MNWVLYIICQQWLQTRKCDTFVPTIFVLLIWEVRLAHKRWTIMCFTHKKIGSVCEIFLSGLFCPYNVSIYVFYVPKYQFVTVISVFAGSNCDQSSRVLPEFCSCSLWLQQANPVYHSWTLSCIMCNFIMSVIISIYYCSKNNSATNIKVK